MFTKLGALVRRYKLVCVRGETENGFFIVANNQFLGCSQFFVVCFSCTVVLELGQVCIVGKQTLAKTRRLVSKETVVLRRCMGT